MVFSTLKIRFKYDCMEYVTTISKSDITGDECDWWDYWFNEGFYTFQVVGDMFEGKVPTDNNLRVFVYTLGDYENDDRIAEIKDIDIIGAEWKCFRDIKVGDFVNVPDEIDCHSHYDESLLYHLEDLRNHINEIIDTMSKPRYKWVLTSNHSIDGISYCSGEFLDKECCYEDMRKNAMELFDQFSSEQIKENKFVTIKFKESAIWFDLGYDYLRFTYNIIKC